MKNTPTQSIYTDIQPQFRADMFLKAGNSRRDIREGFSEKVLERFLRQSTQYLRGQSAR